ncbi:MAG: tRNA (adenosine(37)-N6)-threonylcarbamoyltransferase complex ATPase subunit type 1 TsaE [Candidatus Coatesbacteria bacterium]|nr:tRNA (adenosine(37)-N6)-threonylcarbamoyltransferase complex ATPase subunit type 1 TsaE [Candidatus Coatesbacteria bacterium]
MTEEILYDYLSSSEEETMMLGMEFAESISKGDLILLYGELGAGKTCFIKGILRGLRINEIANSPSFIVVRQFEDKMKINHIDLYRLSSRQMLLDYGIDEYIDDIEAVTLVEWAENLLLDCSPSFNVFIKKLDNNNREIIIIKKTD